MLLTALVYVGRQLIMLIVDENEDVHFIGCIGSGCSRAEVWPSTPAL